MGASGDLKTTGDLQDTDGTAPFKDYGKDHGTGLSATLIYRSVPPTDIGS